jgi:hypothetical protein
LVGREQFQIGDPPPGEEAGGKDPVCNGGVPFSHRNARPPAQITRESILGLRGKKGINNI